MKKKHQTIGSNAIDGAVSSLYWGKRTKHYKGVAGKGGKTHNQEIPEWMHDKKEENENA